MLNWAYKWYDPQGRLSITEVAAQFTALALGGLAAAEPSAPPSGRRAASRTRRTDISRVAPLGFDNTRTGG
jgi:hypothetical protein